jgi:hypothetical protein
MQAQYSCFQENHISDATSVIVTAAKAGVQSCISQDRKAWIPASAGMTVPQLLRKPGLCFLGRRIKSTSLGCRPHRHTIVEEAFQTALG